MWQAIGAVCSSTPIQSARTRRTARYNCNTSSSTAVPKNQHLKLSADAASVWPTSCARAACVCRARLWQAATASATLCPAQVCDAVALRSNMACRSCFGTFRALLHRAQGLHSHAAIAAEPAAHRCSSRRGFSSAGLAITANSARNRPQPCTCQGAFKSQSSSMWLSCSGHLN